MGEGAADAYKVIADDGLVIRRNDPAALPRFAEMNLAWIRELHHVEASDQLMADHPERYVADGNSVFSVHDGEEIIGVCALKQDEDGAWELTKMAVDARARGRGVGAMLMDVVERYARDTLGLEEIYLLSNTKNAAAIRLYTRHGWEVFLDGEHPKYARCNIGMRKTL